MEHVYFIAQAASGRIKIGFTNNLNTRLAGISNGLSDRILLLGNIEGGRLLERAIHRHLAAYRLQGEWFRDCAEVRGVIDNILSRGPEEALDFVGPRSLPKPGRNNPQGKFGAVVRALWPDRPAANLARRVPCTERAAQFYIDGERKPSARAVLAIINEIVE